MGSFLGGGDKSQVAQEAFRFHSQVGILSYSQDKNNGDKGC